MTMPGQTRSGQATQGGPAGKEQDSRMRTAVAAESPPLARLMEAPHVDDSDAVSVAPSTATAVGAGRAAGRKSTVDEWSIIT